MPLWVLFHRTYQICRVAMQGTSYSPSPSNSYTYLRFQPKWVSTYAHSSIPTLSCSCTLFMLNAVPPRESKAFAGTKLLQAAQLSGKAIKTNTETKISSQVLSNDKDETQRVLVDYLHATRNLHFAYAEHMARNAPNFVGKLLAKARAGKDTIAGKDIRKAVDKYLQYNPINEFEPFLESIGIKPSRVGDLLAPDQIYLSDNTVLMHNVSTLWDYGIPWNRLGKIYKEENDIFSYPPGVLQGKFEAYENLGFSKTCLAKLFYCCPFLLKGSLNKEFDVFLNNLYRLGMGKDQICSFLESNPSNWGGISEKLRLLDSLGCPRDEVRRYVRTNLHALAKCSEECLRSKVVFFKKLRMVNNDIGKIILQYPKILPWDIHKSTLEDIKLWTGKELEQTELQCIVQNFPQVLGAQTFKSSSEQMTGFTDSFRILASGQRQKFSFLLELGFDKNSVKTLVIAKKLRGRVDVVRDRTTCLMDLGMSSDVICHLIRSCPTMLCQSRDKLEKKVNLLLNAGYSLESLKSYPYYLICSLENRIEPRCRLLEWLKAKNAFKKNCTLASLFKWPDQKFLSLLVSLHPDTDKVFQCFKRKSGKVQQ